MTAFVKFSEALDPQKVKNQPCLLASYEHPVFREAALPFEDTENQSQVSAEHKSGKSKDRRSKVSLIQLYKKERSSKRCQML